MSGPLVVNLKDGSVWTRRGALRDGAALYAPAGVCDCPEYVMATEAELAEHGIAGVAYALPMPVAKPVAEGLSAERLAKIRRDYADFSSDGTVRVLLAEVDRLRVERDAFCDRVDTLTSVAMGNRRHVVAVTEECQRLAAEVMELRAERHSTNESLSEAAETLRANRDRIAELEALTPASVQTCRKCGAGYTYGEPCSVCLFKARMAAETGGAS
ncbi:hypothetical protein [Streptomyces acidiscabies]|uniref:hypothetical protein n=1 Tax=Streptomyces acidiscabies TaxID=42234 RepID=UPI000952444A|nr:hypothetical protein [Streptomyces acidiscabies]